MYKKIIAVTLTFITSHTFATNPNSAADFYAAYLMNSALDVSQDSNQEQPDLSHNAGMKKAQEYLLSINPYIQRMMRNIERHAQASNLASDDIGDWVDAWGKAERINIRLSDYDFDPNRQGDNIDLNRSFNLVLKFAREHNVHHLDDITIRIVPQISQTQDGELSIQGWYCESDIDDVEFTRDWQEPLEDSSSPQMNVAVKGHRSMILRALPYPFSHCVVAKEDIKLPTLPIIEKGIDVSLTTHSDNLSLFMFIH